MLYGEPVWSDCFNCSNEVSDVSCPEDYAAFVPPRIQHYTCVFEAADGEEMPGCTLICHPAHQNHTCCAGFYGLQCEECPGGALLPCTGHGVCFDTLTGNGTCQCEPGFVGTDCAECEDRSFAPPHCNTTHTSCEREVSGCDQNALCHANMTGPGQCTCSRGYHGDGQWCRENVSPCESEKFGGCDVGRASCTYLTPRVTDLQDGEAVCSCLDSYVGNGSLCLYDMMDALSRLPGLDYFRDNLTQANVTNITSLLENLNGSITMFAPFGQYYKNLEYSNLIVVNQSLWLPEEGSMEKPGERTKSVQIFTLIDSVTALGGLQINITMNDIGQLFANGVLIVERNIETVNGVLHITAAPIAFVEEGLRPSASTAASHSTVVMASVGAIIVLIIIIIVVVGLYVTYRRKGTFNIFKRSDEQSQSRVSFARLGTSDDDSDSYRSSDATKYDNPVFDDPDADLM